MKKLVTTSILSVLVLSACNAPTEPDAEVIDIMGNTDVGEDSGMMEMEEEKMEGMMEMEFMNSGILNDVSGGSAIGTVKTNFADGEYLMVAEFSGLPALEDGYFYEGWVVRRGEDMSVISTGPTEMMDGEEVNVYMSSEDLTDHDFYVLTLEPDDGDPAPAEHILQGVIQ